MHIFSILLAVASLFASCHAATDQSVLLTAENFEENIGAGKYFVMFSKPP
jgi:hypothetical protein